MKFLIDTNVFIPLEPTRLAELESLTETTVRLARLAIESAHQLYIHPAACADIAKDTDEARSKLRRILLRKYPTLPDPPGVPAEIEALLGKASLGTNDWVDHQLIAALVADAVDFLVTEDRRLRKKALRFGLGNRAFTIAEAISLIADLSEKVLCPPPAVRPVKAHALNATDPIFKSLREDYSGFNEWFRKCKLEHRQAWIIEGHGGSLAAFCIINREKDPPKALKGRILKICSFKVSHLFNGYRFGELILKAVFEHGFENHYDWIFVTVFEKHEKLIEILGDFGFLRLDEKTNVGELMLAKPLNPDVEDAYLRDDLEYHVRYGPRFFRTESAWHIVPIQPPFAEVLFPESEPQETLFPGLHPYGNAIRKAYLCKSRIKSISPGSVLVFYRSRSNRGAIALGIVEKTFVSKSSVEIVRAVGKRTVYSLQDIENMCEGPVLAILFRQARVLYPAISSDELIKGKVFARAPQSIMHLEGEGLEWLQAKVAK